MANRPPTAALTVSPTMLAAGRRVRLDATGSRDPEGLRLVYEWDLDGDGTFEAGSGSTAVANKAFTVDGRKLVRVRVNDPHGGRAVAEAWSTWTAACRASPTCASRPAGSRGAPQPGRTTRRVPAGRRRGRPRFASGSPRRRR